MAFCRMNRMERLMSWNFAISSGSCPRELPLKRPMRVCMVPISPSVTASTGSVRCQQAANDPNCVGPNANLTSKCFLTSKVTNPFYGKISQGTLQNSTVTQNQLLRPYPQYGSLTNPDPTRVSATTTHYR